MRLLRVFLVTALIALGLALMPSASGAGGEAFQAIKTLDPTNQSYSYFGDSIAPAGDINGDGYEDVIAGAPRWISAIGEEGRAYVYLGSADGFGPTPITLDPTDQQWAHFGESVAPAGDVNNDGYDDVVVGAPDWSSQQGRIYLYLGAAAGFQTPLTFDGGTRFGYAISPAGDVDNDGYDDFIVGAPYYDNPKPWPSTGYYTDGGRAFLYRGAPGGVVYAQYFNPANQDYARFGYALAAAGDVNNDGYDDVVFGAPWKDGQVNAEGRAYVYLGSASGLQQSTVVDPTDQAGAQFGLSLAAVDTNADGYDDIIAGAPSVNSATGRAYVYRGSASGIQASPSQELAPNFNNGASYGFSLGAAGDVNDDGYEDVVVGAPYWDGQQTDEGRAYLHLGSTSGLQSYFTLDPTDQAGAYFGYSAASAGDIDNDGYDDAIVGAPYWNTIEGRVYLVEKSRAPVLDPIGDKTVNEGEGIQFSIHATDPNHDPLTLYAQNRPTGASFSSATGTFTWTPTHYQAGEYEVTFGAQDPVGLFDPETVTITVVNVNGPPSIDPISDKNVAEDETLSFEVTATDPDAEELTYWARRLPVGASFDDSTHVFTWKPTYDQAGSYAPIFRVEDEAGHRADAQVNISVGDMNRAPDLDSIGAKSTSENAELSFTINATDPDGDAMIYSASGLPEGAAFDPDTKTFSWTPSYAQSGTHDVTIKVEDPGQLFDEETVTITVTNVNRAPVLDSIGNRSGAEAEEMSFSITASDVDSDGLTYSGTDLPAGASLDPATGEFRWTPSYDDAGGHEVTFEVTDGTEPDSETILIVVDNTNRTPELAAIGDKAVAEGGDLSFELGATDPDGDPLTFSASNLPPGAVFNADTRTFSWMPGYDQADVYGGVGFEVADGLGAKDDEVISITVTDATPPSSTTTLVVDKTSSALKPHGKVRPNDDDHPGLPVKVTMYKKKSGQWVKLSAKSPLVTETGTYATKFDRPRAGTFKFVSKFACEHHLPSSASAIVKL
jgi:Putative Ig domain/FG-GAP repeat